MLGSFGDIIFETSDKRLLNFEGFKRDTASVYENHKLMGQKPRTEFVAPGLDTVTFTVILRSRFGVKPRDEMNRWIEYARSGNAETLEIGGRALGVDKWVVTSASQHWDTMFNRGELISGKVDVTLQEYVSTMWTVKAYQERLERLEAGNGPKLSEFQADLESGKLPIYNEFGQQVDICGNPIEKDDWEDFGKDGKSSSAVMILNEEAPLAYQKDYVGFSSKNKILVAQIEEIRQYTSQKISNMYNKLYGRDSDTIWGADVWKRTLNGADIVEYVQRRGIYVEGKMDYAKLFNSSFENLFGVYAQTEYIFYLNSVVDPIPINEFYNICGPYWDEDWKTLWRKLALDWLGIMVSVGLAGYYILSNVSISSINVNLTTHNWSAAQTIGGFGTIYVRTSDTITKAIPKVAVYALPAALIEQITFCIVNNGLSGSPPSGGGGSGSELNIDGAQFGKKIGKHAQDYGLDPADPNARNILKNKINDIYSNPTEIRQGEWRGLGEKLPNGANAPGQAKFYIQGDDVVITDLHGNFVTIMKGGLNNPRVMGATNLWP